MKKISLFTTRILCHILCVCVLTVAIPQKAEATETLNYLYNKYFKKKPEGLQPEDTLIAPFASQDKATGTIAKDSKIPRIRSNTSRLDKPHRSSADVGSWLARALAEIFTVNPRKYDEHLKHLATGMDEHGLKNFRDFMIDNKILVILQENDLVLSNVIEEEPLLLKKAVLNGRYRWLYDVPIILSMIKKRDLSNQPITEEELANNIRVMVRVGLGRVAAGGMEGVAIETLEIRIRRVE